MVPGVESEIHGVGQREHLAMMAIRRVVKILQRHLDPVLKIFLQKGFPVLAGAINYQWSHRRFLVPPFWDKSGFASTLFNPLFSRQLFATLNVSCLPGSMPR
jgi:hypothetical protein